MLYNVVLLHPEGCPHTMAVREPGLLLYHSLQSLGLSARFQINRLEHSAINILLGYHFLYDPAPLNGHHCIIYQLEQLSDDPARGWFTPAAHQILCAAQTVWDYDSKNVEFLKSKGLPMVRHLPLGFHESLYTIRPVALPDIDVLFYGSTNPRRCHILDELAKRCRVESLYGVYADQRDQYIARAKIILNIHLHGMQLMEQVRIAHLLNNGCFVVSEDCTTNPFEEMIVTAPYEQLVETCLNYLNRAQDRAAVAQRGMELFGRNWMMDHLRRVLMT